MYKVCFKTLDTKVKGGGENSHRNTNHFKKHVRSSNGGVVVVTF